MKKARFRSMGVNVSAEKLNTKFLNELLKFEYQSKYRSSLKTLLLSKLKAAMSDALEASVQLKKKETELTNLIERMEERFVTGEISQELYTKYELKYKEQIQSIRVELRDSCFDSSNLELAVEKMLDIASNLSQIWSSSGFDVKQKLQYLVFPDGILYNKEKNIVRTPKINSLFACIPPLQRKPIKNKNGSSVKNCHLIDPVPGTGLFYDPGYSHEGLT